MNKMVCSFDYIIYICILLLSTRSTSKRFKRIERNTSILNGSHPTLKRNIYTESSQIYHYSSSTLLWVVSSCILRKWPTFTYFAVGFHVCESTRVLCKSLGKNSSRTAHDTHTRHCALFVRTNNSYVAQVHTTWLDFFPPLVYLFLSTAHFTLCSFTFIVDKSKSWPSRVRGTCSTIFFRLPSSRLYNNFLHERNRLYGHRRLYNINVEIKKKCIYKYIHMHMYRCSDVTFTFHCQDRAT